MAAGLETRRFPRLSWRIAYDPDRSEEKEMPTYDFHCEKCKKDFAKTMSFKERDRKHVECPHCNSKQVRQVVTAVSVKTSSKS